MCLDLYIISIIRKRDSFSVIFNDATEEMYVFVEIQMPEYTDFLCHIKEIRYFIHFVSMTSGYSWVYP